MKIAFFHYENKDNKYTSIIIEILNNIDGFDVRSFTLKSFVLFSKGIWNSQIIWLNWFETVNSSSKALLRLLSLIILKLIRKKIVYTLHNKRPHQFNQTLTLKLLQIGLYHFSDLIIVHSKLSMHEIPSRYHGNVRIIPHPNYINEYGRIITENDDTENNQKLKLLF